jgi:hypothetical protein
MLMQGDVQGWLDRTEINANDLASVNIDFIMNSRVSSYTSVSGCSSAVRG